jgi:hypothetical protein
MFESRTNRSRKTTCSPRRSLFAVASTRAKPSAPKTTVSPTSGMTTEVTCNSLLK